MTTSTGFDYLLNAFEMASQSDNPALNQYAAKRAALFRYVRGLEADSARLTYLQDGSCSVRAVMDMDPEADVGFVVAPYNDNEMPGRTLREAIDACMRGEYDVPNTPVRATATVSHRNGR